jgi:hypothetical protein
MILSREQYFASRSLASDNDPTIAFDEFGSLSLANERDAKCVEYACPAGPLMDRKRENLCPAGYRARPQKIRKKH